MAIYFLSTANITNKSLVKNIIQFTVYPIHCRRAVTFIILAVMSLLLLYTDLD